TAAARARTARAETAGAARVAHFGSAETAHRVVDAGAEAAGAEHVRHRARLSSALQDAEQAGVQSDLAILLAFVRIDARRTGFRRERVLLRLVLLPELAFFALVLRSALHAGEVELLLLLLLLLRLQDHLREAVLILEELVDERSRSVRRDDRCRDEEGVHQER